MPDRKPRAPTLYFIIVVKLIKGLLLLLVALGVYTLAGKDLRAQFDSFLGLMSFDPEKKFFSTIDTWLDSVTPNNVRWVATGTLRIASDEADGADLLKAELPFALTTTPSANSGTTIKGSFGPGPLETFRPAGSIPSDHPAMRRVCR